MVLDVLENKERYYPLHKNFKAAFDFLQKAIKDKPAPGKYELKGDDLFAVVQSYETVDDGNWEAHRKYIDIQFIIEGCEIIEWANIANLPPEVKYNEENDFLDCGHIENSTSCKMQKGDFLILWPEDLHKPKCVWDEKSNIVKVVVKIAL